MKINFDRLVDLMDGDKDMAKRLILSFQEEIPQHLKLLDEYFESSDYKMISNTVHVIKTQAAYLGLEAIQEISRNIESSAEKNIPKNELKVLFDKLNESMRAFVDEQDESNYSS